jgi:RNA polymerase sigma factor (sigma-70 family)
MNNEEIILSDSIPVVDKILMLFEQNKGLIKNIASKYAKRNDVCSEEDYIQECALVLIKYVIPNYNVSSGALSTYLTRVFTTACSRLANTFVGPFSMDHNLKSVMRKIKKLTEEGKSREDIVRILDISIKTFDSLTIVNTMSIVAVNDEIDISSKDDFTEGKISSIIEEAKLSDIEKKITFDRMSGMTLREIGQKHNKSYEWARNIETSAFRKVKKVLV